MNHESAPLYEALCAYAKNKNTTLHVPGHKDGETFDAQAMAHFQSILELDATEISGLDDLHHPTEVIAQAQQLAANAFGAEHTFFLIGGTTAGNLAAALTLCSPGDTILVQRNAHKSVCNGLLLAGAHPVYMVPQIEPMTQAAAGIHAEQLQEALSKYPEAKAVWITNPNYYGMTQDVRALAEICHEADLPLIVDEAHGAHLGQVEALPPSALQAGADLVVQSTHKMLTAMTMASMLHVQGRRIPIQRLASVLSMIQSSSPSYPLMASLDVARRYLVVQGRRQLPRTIVKLEQHRATLNKQLEHLLLWHAEESDPLKWVITSCHTALSGYQLLDALQKRGYVAEMADIKNVVLVFSIAASDMDIQRIADAILEIDRMLCNLPSNKDEPGFQNDQSERLSAGTKEVIKPSISLQEAFHSDKEKVRIEEAEGRICAEMVIPYPPGIPLLTPGERITAAHIETIHRIERAGGYFQGALDEQMKAIFVLVNR
ncbi:aminotransferase class I/II-fold pyridoxal phosphate-dependent enzyme [Aneurinibacillus sp. REN35]|uniref:aminotransferase class I/II-fold pyridoxal phosphate-dependent enzyme n=1 Tax=Aneurinibacillus sp. REN35 TaxID=3237286 RepID=UPI003528E0D1